jgi:protein-disulfide isomerase
LTVIRRAFIATVTVTALLVALGASWPPGAARAQTAEEVNKVGALGDMALGPNDASVTVIEYASMTCPHCANFAKEVFAKIKTDYIDTGKVRYIFREFPLDPVALAASALARCVAKDDAAKYFTTVDTLFKQQNDLASDPHATIYRVGKESGLSEEMAKACVEDDPKTQEAIMDGRGYAYDTLKVTGTPFFFVNGKPLEGPPSFEEFEKLIKPLLKG